MSKKSILALWETLDYPPNRFGSFAEYLDALIENSGLEITEKEASELLAMKNEEVVV